jgi:hypothetical protein
MNQPSNFRYTHSDHTRVLRDVRSSLLPEVTLAQFYFTGFRIDTADGVVYRRAMIMADDYDSFAAGVSEERHAIQELHPAICRDDIALVFMRNLGMQDPQLVDSIVRHNIDADARKMLARRDDNLFTVFGLLGESICLIPEMASDALAAVQMARCQSIKLAGKNFMPLEVCQAHPVTREFDALFDTVANRIMALVGSIPTEGGYVH